MPEGHISHRNAGLLEAALAGHTITRVEVPSPRIAAQRLDRRLPGETVARAEAVGKHHLLHLASGRVLHSHLLMSGIWRVRPAGTPLGRGGLFLTIHAGEHVAALYRCPTVRLFEPGEPLPPAVRGAGPDLLDPAVIPAEATATALGAAEAHRQVGEVLLDQRAVAGIGNVYKNETCFLAGVDPWRAVATLTAAEAGELGTIAAALLADGVRDRGAIRTYRPPGAPPWSRQRTWVHRPRRSAVPALRHPRPLPRAGDANRTTYWCPVCQS